MRRTISNSSTRGLSTSSAPVRPMSTTRRQEEMRVTRGTLDRGRDQQPVPRPRRRRKTSTCSARMRAGEFPNGARVLRAKIDMASGNINLRDPVLYRILHARASAHRHAWCIYPSYDFAHGQSDAIEGVTHSLCTLEFEDHRPLYDWLLDNLPVPSRPRQIRVRAARTSPTRCCRKRVLHRARARRPRRGLGRSAHADARRAAPARRAAGSDPRFRASASVSPRRTASSTWRCSSSPSARI